MMAIIHLAAGVSEFVVSPREFPRQITFRESRSLDVECPSWTRYCFLCKQRVIRHRLVPPLFGWCE